MLQMNTCIVEAVLPCFSLKFLCAENMSKWVKFAFLPLYINKISSRTIFDFLCKNTYFFYCSFLEQIDSSAVFCYT